MADQKRANGGPRFVRYFGPLLDALRVLGGSGSAREVTEQVAKNLKVSESYQAELTDTGVPRFYNEVAWARFYLTRAGLLDSSIRGVWRLSEEGRSTHLSTGSVGPSQVRDFRGAMQGRADKGIIVTTGAFTSDARREAVRDGVTPIELVDGEKLMSMFETLELGLKPVSAYELEPGFFAEFGAKQ